MIWHRDFQDAQFGHSAILKNETLDVISSVGPIARLIDLERLLDHWVWFGKYGDELLELLNSLAIPPMQPKPKETRGKKRPQPTGETDLAAAAVGVRTQGDKRAKVTAVRVPSSTPRPVQTPTAAISEASLPTPPIYATPIVPSTPRHDHHYIAPPPPGYMGYYQPYPSPSMTPMQPFSFIQPSHYYVQTPIRAPNTSVAQETPPVRQIPFTYEFHHYNPDSSSSSQRK